MTGIRKSFFTAGIALTGLSLVTAGLSCAQESSAPAAQTPPAAAPAPPHNTMRPAIKWKRFDYTCENNVKITVYLNGNTVKVRYGDNFYLMKQVVAADGTRYSDGKVIWWSKGNDGFLQEDTPDGDGQKIVKDCYLEKPPAEETSYGTVSGTITYLVRMALPPQAVIEVQLQDVSRADAPAAVVALAKFPLGPRSSPVPFLLKYETAKIDPKHTYAVSARILVMGELRFANKEAYPVLTQGHPNKVDLVVLPVGGGKP
jgi:putative lipoprotein